MRSNLRAIKPWRLLNHLPPIRRIKPQRLLSRRTSSTLSIGRSCTGTVDIPTVPWCNFVLEHARSNGEKIAFVDAKCNRSINFSQFHEQVKRVAAALMYRGFDKNDVMLTNATNCIEYPVVVHAVGLIGGVMSPASPVFIQKECEVQMEAVKGYKGGKTFLFTNDLVSGVASAAADTYAIPSERRVLVGQCLTVEGEPAAGVTFEDILEEGKTVLAVAGVNEGSSLQDGPWHNINAAIDPLEDVAILPFSSGTTGPPKGVMLSHTNMVANLVQSTLIEPYQGDTYIGILPMYHIYGAWAFLSYSPYHGATTAVLPSFDLSSFCKTIEKYKVSRVHVAPPVVVLMAKSPVIDEYDLSSLKMLISGAAPLSAEVEEQVVQRLGVRVKQASGMTEMSPISHMCPDDDIRKGSIGMLMPSMEYAVRDLETGKPGIVPVGEEGELCWKGPQIMKGYLNNPEATANTYDSEGFLKSGDIGKVDADGFFFITDRLKELIKYKGRQVAPAELEALLLTHEGIADACVIASEMLIKMADGTEYVDEVPKAYVVKRKGDISEADVMDFVAGQVASYKKVRKVEFIDEIPKTASGKLLRKDLVALDRAME